jgi:tyrosyl-tRNA synthetase
MSVIDVLRKRGFIENTTHENELHDYIAAGNATCYIGFDPTASSFHVGSLIPIMALAHMQLHGHRPIALVGGGTGLVGDPSGKTEMRQLLSIEKVEENAIGLKEQLSRFIQFGGGDGGALLLNNADWLVGLEYIPFLRDIGRHFSVNRMIKAESYKARIESEEGLNFIEFNYMLLQAYDFLKLFDDCKCRIQMGGSDQWGNIVAGIDLVRRMRQETTFGITFPLVTTSSGAKMGKSASGAVWLDSTRTSPYDYYQYWVNTDDKDVVRFLALFTFLPMEEIREVGKLEGADLNSAKTVLAFETTKLCHGEAESFIAYRGAVANFGLRLIPKNILPSSSVHKGGDISIDITPAEVLFTGSADITAEVVAVPHSFIEQSELKSGIPAFKLYQKVGLAKSGSDARRLIQQGGAYINGNRVESDEELITLSHIVNGEIALRAGKKKFHKIKVKM